MCQFLNQVNVWAVLASGIVYWLLGSLWFSRLFGKTWVKEIERLGIKHKKPTKNKMIKKSIATLILNLVTSLGVALVVIAAVPTCVVSAICLGLILGICFVAATMGMGKIWEGRSTKLTLIDIGYPMVGIILSALILTYWK